MTNKNCSAATPFYFAETPVSVLIKVSSTLVNQTVNNSQKLPGKLVLNDNCNNCHRGKLKPHVKGLPMLEFSAFD